ncbi:hypothetical protein CS022_07020 [Veronia nyctiphanis]|uniref:Uncharacterized protein n=1 Tax=Veronia nyctiphanis TaxID=1278244 RepID=A0A4V1LT29_9GAMM|nr:questin oxidase family protein [Veronia nyctiphanis]RXJ73758.1 hypothetical protein CS022_07020 [Veronia nyctiphanis]
MFSPLTENSLQLVSQAHKYLPTYGGSLSNHLPMALMAMEKIGANRQQLETEYRAHEQHLELFSESRLINNLQPERGNPDTLLALIDFYHADIVANGMREAVEKAINELLPGLAAASFHGIIRLSYAVESNSPHEVSHALGLFAANYVSPGPLIRDPMLTLEQHLGNATTRFSDQKYPEGLFRMISSFCLSNPDTKKLLQYLK